MTDPSQHDRVPPTTTRDEDPSLWQFDTADLLADLSRHTVRGGAAMAFAHAAKMVLTLGSTVVLARLLTPADFGLVAMVAAVTNFLSRFKDLGLAGATVQRAHVSHDQISALFWINLAFGLALAVILAAISPAVAWFYGKPRLMLITIVLASAFVLTGLTVQHHALLRRQMRFGTLAIIDVASVTVGIVAGVSAALAGLGCWSLVILQLATAAALAVGVWIACGWRPTKPARAADLRPMLKFGGNLAAANVLKAVRSSVQQALIGRFCGAVPLGLYSKASQLLELPVRQIGNPMSQVAVPTLSRLQENPERYRAFYRQGVEILALLGVPVGAFMLVSAEPVVLTVLGDQWAPAANILRCLVPAALVASLAATTGWPYTSLGHTDRQFRWMALSTVVIVAATIVGVRWGAIGVAASYSAAVCALRVPGILYCIRGTMLRPADVFGPLWRPFTAVSVAGVLAFVLARFTYAGLAPAAALAADLAVFTAGYCLCWLVLPGGRRIIRDLFELLKLLRRSHE